MVPERFMKPAGRGGKQACKLQKTATPVLKPIRIEPAEKLLTHPNTKKLTGQGTDRVTSGMVHDDVPGEGHPKSISVDAVAKLLVASGNQAFVKSTNGLKHLLSYADTGCGSIVVFLEGGLDGKPQPFSMKSLRRRRCGSSFPNLDITGEVIRVGTSKSTVHPFQPGPVDTHVRINEGDQFRPAVLNPPISSGVRGLYVQFFDHAALPVERLEFGPDYLRRLIGGTVIDNDDLEVIARKGLLKKGLQGGPNSTRIIVYRNDHRDIDVRHEASASTWRLR